MARRPKIPHADEIKVLMKNKHQCCVCRELRSSREIQIHHIDGDPSNNGPGNLAVLCTVHHDMANIGLKKGTVGQAKKLTREAVRQYKGDWERRVEDETKVRTKTIPVSERKHLETLYKFEISRRKSEILALLPQKKLREDNYRFLVQLSVEQTLSGLRLRPLLLRAFIEIAFLTHFRRDIALEALELVTLLFVRLKGPDEEKMRAEDKRMLADTVRYLGALGGFYVKSPRDSDARVLAEVCSVLYELAEVSSWYRFISFLERSVDALKEIRVTCSHYERNDKHRDKRKVIRIKMDIVDNTLRAIQDLRRRTT
jgi:hypothetical protein